MIAHCHRYGADRPKIWSFSALLLLAYFRLMRRALIGVTTNTNMLGMPPSYNGVTRIRDRGRRRAYHGSPPRQDDR